MVTNNNPRFMAGDFVLLISSIAICEELIRYA